ncbi:MAG: hypothetical protein QM490_03175 [Candidatus Gracilibacteria bacterium]
MDNKECLVFELDDIGTLCSSTREIAINYMRLYEKDKTFKDILDTFLDSFNEGREQKLTHIDIINIQKGEEKKFEKVTLIKEFLDTFINDFNIGFSVNNIEFVGIEGSINSIRDSVSTITTGEINPEDIDIFTKVIIDFLSEIKSNVKNILADHSFKQALYDLLSGLCKRGQKEFLLKIAEGIKGSEKYSKLVIYGNGSMKSDSIILRDYISGGDNKIISKVYSNLNVILGDKDKTQKLKNKFLLLFIEILIDDKEILEGIINTETWNFSYEVNDFSERKRPERKVRNEDYKPYRIINKKELPLIQRLVNSIDNITLDEQSNFFIDFHKILLNSAKYYTMTRFNNGKKRTTQGVLQKFTGNASSFVFNKLLVKGSAKLGRRVIRRFVSKVLIDTDLANIVSDVFGIDKKQLITEKKNINKDSRVFGKLNETDRNKFIIIKARIVNDFSSYSLDKQRKFILEIYSLLSGKKPILDNDSNKYKELNIFFKDFIGKKANHIYYLFFLQNQKINNKKYIENFALALTTNTISREHCIDRFGLNNDMLELEKTRTEEAVLKVKPVEVIEDSVGVVREKNVVKKKKKKNVVKKNVPEIKVVEKKVAKKENNEVDRLTLMMSMHKKIKRKKINTYEYLSIPAFIPALQHRINGIAKKQDISYEFLEDCIIEQIDFISVLQYYNDSKIDIDLFLRLSSPVKESQKWQNIFSIISEEELNEFLFEYIRMEK